MTIQNSSFGTYRPIRTISIKPTGICFLKESKVGGSGIVTVTFTWSMCAWWRVYPLSIALKFNERFRYSDAVADIAFLLMDLEFHGGMNDARVLWDHYRELSKEAHVDHLLKFYKVYRAFVRGKVNGFQIDDPCPLVMRKKQKLFNVHSPTSTWPMAIFLEDSCQLSVVSCQHWRLFWNLRIWKYGRDLHDYAQICINIFKILWICFYWQLTTENQTHHTTSVIAISDMPVNPGSPKDPSRPSIPQSPCFGLMISGTFLNPALFKIPDLLVAEGRSENSPHGLWHIVVQRKKFHELPDGPRWEGKHVQQNAKHPAF